MSSSFFLPPFTNPPCGGIKETEREGKKEEVREGIRRGKREGGREGGILSQSHPLSLHYFILPSLSPFLSPCLSFIPLSLPISPTLIPLPLLPPSSSFLLTPSFPSSPNSNFYLSINSPLCNLILNQVCNTSTGDLLFTSFQDKKPCFCFLNQTGSLAIVGYCGGVFKVCLEFIHTVAHAFLGSSSLTLIHTIIHLYMLHVHVLARIYCMYQLQIFRNHDCIIIYTLCCIVVI